MPSNAGMTICPDGPTAAKTRSTTCMDPGGTGIRAGDTCQDKVVHVLLASRDYQNMETVRHYFRARVWIVGCSCWRRTKLRRRKINIVGLAVECHGAGTFFRGNSS